MDGDTLNPPAPPKGATGMVMPFAQPNIQAPSNQANTKDIPQAFGGLRRTPFEPREDLIKALTSQESGGDPNATGKAGEKGLMQILPATAAQYGVKPEQLTNPDVNRQTGTRYLSDLLKRYNGNEFLALVAYNSGPGRVDKGQLLPQSVKYATQILNKAGMGGMGKDKPDFMSQVQFAKGSPQQSSILSRIGQSLMGGLEGTAYAQEGPPPPPPPGSTGPVESMGAAPSPPSGATTPATATPPPPPGAGPVRAFDPSQMRATIGFSSTGPRISFAQVTPPANVRTQEAAAKIVEAQVNDAIGYYDKNLKPHEGEYTGNLLTPGGRHGLAQPFESTHSKWAQAFGLGGPGGQADPAVQSFYDKVGPVMAEQLKSLIGGRVGQGMIDGPLAPHLPNIEQDSLPRIRAKLDDLKANVPIIVQQIQQMRSAGMTDDQIIASPPAWPGTPAPAAQPAPTATPAMGTPVDPSTLDDADKAFIAKLHAGGR